MKRKNENSLIKYLFKIPKSDENIVSSVNIVSSENNELSENTVSKENVQLQEVVDDEESFNQEIIQANDIRFYDPVKMNDEEKLNAISKIQNPDLDFEFPQSIKSGRKLRFSRKWIQTYSWIFYSKSCDGVFCKFCYFFASGSVAKYLITDGFANWHKGTEYFNSHQLTNYHKSAQNIVLTRNKILDGNISSIDIQIDKQITEQKHSNQALIFPIIEAILLCGRQNIPLRGHQDSGALFSTDSKVNDGNLRSLLRWRAQSDSSYMELVKKAPKNATYLSPLIQNEIISIIENILIERRLSKLRKSSFFSIFADETSDNSNQEQMAVGVRYFDTESQEINEDFIKFIHIKDLKALGISNELLNVFKELSIDLKFCVGQGYDGAPVMSGDRSGVAKRIRDKYPKAIYLHCMSHCLNLALTESCNNTMLKSCQESIKNIFNFFNTPKRQNILAKSIEEKCPETTKKKLKNVCPTRFVERHQTTATFIELYAGVILALHEISDWNDASSHEAIGHLNSITTFQFLISLYSLDSALSITIGLSRYLQTVCIDLKQATEAALNIVEIFKSIEIDSMNEFQKIFSKASNIAENYDIAVAKPRHCGRPRNDGVNRTVLEYYHNLFYLPLIQTFSNEIEEKFLIYKDILNSFNVVCANTDLRDQDIEQAVPLLLEFYDDYLNVSDTQLIAEIKMWQQKIGKLAEKPSSLIHHIKICHKDFFPNVYKLLQILVALPVTNCTLERSFSRLKKIKSFDRATMSEERLNGLTLLAVYRHENIDAIEVVKEMSKIKRRTNFEL